MIMLPLCSTSSSQLSFCDARPFSVLSKNFKLRCMVKNNIIFGSSNQIHLQGFSVKAKSIHSGYVETVSVINDTSENMDYTNSLSSLKASAEDFVTGIKDSINASVDNGENVVKRSVDTINLLVKSVIKGVSDTVDNATGEVFSRVDQTGQLAGSKLENLSSALKEASSKAGVVAIDQLRHTIVFVEESLTSGIRFIVYTYGSAKELLPLDFRNVIDASDEKTSKLLRPAIVALQQIYFAIEGLEKSVGLDPSDPIIPFVLLLGTSATLWVLYWRLTYGGYAGNLSPKETLELLKDNALLIDIRPEVLREKVGIPDLRRASRYRYESVTLPEIGGSVRKLLKNGRDLDDTLIAAVIQNLKIAQDRPKVIVMDAEGTRSKGIARSLTKLGIKRAYLVQGGFKSWVTEGLRIKELKPETTLTILNQEAEAILEDVNSTPVQVLVSGLGLIAAAYAVSEWEKTLQLIAIVGLGQSIYSRVSAYENSEDFKHDVGLLLTPVRLAAGAFSWAARKVETNGNGKLPTSPSSSLQVKDRVLQAAAKHESQPSDNEIQQEIMFSSESTSSSTIGDNNV